MAQKNKLSGGVQKRANDNTWAPLRVELALDLAMLARVVARAARSCRRPLHDRWPWKLQGWRWRRASPGAIQGHQTLHIHTVGGHNPAPLPSGGHSPPCTPP